MEVAPDFDEFIACLTAHGVEFVIVGAYALAYHGAPRFTGDLDVLVRPTLDNAARLLSALDGVRISCPPSSPGGHCRRSPDDRDGCAAGPDSCDERDQRRRVARDLGQHVDGRSASEVPYIGRDTLIRNKRAAGRPKDLSDIDALEPGERTNG